jgi:hypothetical protein
MVEASWQPDPGGGHELRYWDGAAWTGHVSDGGVTATAPAPPDLPPPAPPVAPPPPPPPPAAGWAPPDPAAVVPAPATAGKVGWKDRLKQVADQGKALADQGKAKLAEQQSKRTEQWANDPSTLWFGESKGAATTATGMSKARYRITRDRVWLESGVLGTVSESVPLWSVKDIDVRQAVWQRTTDVGDVVLTLEDPAFATRGTGMFDLDGSAAELGRTTGQVVLDNIEGPYAVVDLLSPLVSEARQKKTVERQSQYVHMQPAAGWAAPSVPPPAPAPEAGPDLADQLRKLADLRDAGVLTEDEFAAQKAKLLG